MDSESSSGSFSPKGDAKLPDCEEVEPVIFLLSFISILEDED